MTARAFLKDQMVELASEGWDVHLVCSSQDGTSAFDELRKLDGICIHDIHMLRNPDLLQDSRDLVSWVRLLHKIQPDITIVSTPKAGLLGSVAAFLSRVPTRVYHVRGLRAEGLSGFVALISRNSERIASLLATDVLVDSASLLRLMRQQQLLPARKGSVLGDGSSCGVDVKHFRPPHADERTAAREALSLSARDLVIGFVGRVTPDKGIRELVLASSRVHDRDPRVRLVIAGPAEDDDDVLRLPTLAENDWIRLLGFVEDPRAVLWALDIFCFASLREGFPIAPLEAQACGIPTVTTGATGCVDSVENQVTGLIVPARDAERLSDALSELCKDSERRRAMGLRARERVVRHYDKALVLKNFVNFVDEASGQRIAARRESKAR